MTFPPHKVPRDSTVVLLHSHPSTVRCCERENGSSVHFEPFAFWAAYAHDPLKSRRTPMNTPVISFAPALGIAPPPAPLWSSGHCHALLEAGQCPNTPRQPSHIAQATFAKAEYCRQVN